RSPARVLRHTYQRPTPGLCPFCHPAGHRRVRRRERQIMPKRTDLTSVLVIGSGPIVIGQAAEFDYSGTQAIRVLKDEGIRVVLVNSNPATIMTDPEMADARSEEHTSE